MAELGFGKVRQVASIPVYMSGSRRQLVAYCFVRDEMPDQATEAGGRVGASARRAPHAVDDLSTMPGFLPDDVIGVLSNQASERAAAKAAGAAGNATAVSSSPRSGGSADDDTEAAKDSAAGRRSQRNGGPGALKPARSEQTGMESMGGSQQSDVSSHSYGLRRRGGSAAQR